MELSTHQIRRVKATDPDMIAERKRYRQKLRAIKESINTIGPQLSPIRLKELRIRHESMTLEGDNPPVFFLPYQATIKPPEVDTLSGYPTLDEYPQQNAGSLCWYLYQYFCHCILTPEVAPGPTYSDYGDFNFPSLVDTTRDVGWELHAAWHMPRFGIPHMKVLMHSYSVGGNQPLSGEMLAIINIMIGRLNAKALRPHVNAPILLFSVVGMHHVRVIEAYLHDEELVVRTTPLYDIGRPDPKLFITLSKWWMGNASDRSTLLA